MATNKENDTRKLVLTLLSEFDKGHDFYECQKGLLDKYDYFEREKKAFIKRLSKGCVERQLELDYIIGQFLKKNAKRPKALIMNILRMGVYQLLFMDSVPDSACVNECVKLARNHGFNDLSGFVNGVLRNIARNKDKIQYPDRDKAFLDYVSVKYSLPMWLCEKWLSDYGKEVLLKMGESFLKENPVTVRFKRSLTDREIAQTIESIKEDVGIAKHAYDPYVYTLVNPGNISRLKGFGEGLFTVQDVSGILSVNALKLDKSKKVLDVCAAPGSKALYASELCEKVTACDISEARLMMLSENIERMKASNIEIKQMDATCFNEDFAEKYDCVIADVPCSGLGVIGKKCDIKYNVTPDLIKELSELQRKIASVAFKYVKKGGLFLYSTCTVNKEENENNARWIAENLPLSPVKLNEEDYKAVYGDLHDNKPVMDNTLTLIPGVTSSDGFFFALFRRS
ncbi:MAG: 16S rRNA (cytosine(967)-C(5))-methyltransferase RsmB [Lachnospiraceae bacterium]|nr:16S rRNA (cytosine(967)-C(5))-methyltransferase RsmB [Lachnospiraceae bacterium]